MLPRDGPGERELSARGGTLSVVRARVHGCTRACEGAPTHRPQARGRRTGERASRRACARRERARSIGSGQGQVAALRGVGPTSGALGARWQGPVHVGPALVPAGEQGRDGGMGRRVWASNQRRVSGSWRAVTATAMRQRSREEANPPALSRRERRERTESIGRPLFERKARGRKGPAEENEATNEAALTEYL